RLDRAAGAVAERDVDRRAAVEGGEGQGLARDAAGRRGAAGREGGAGAGRAGQAKRGQSVARTGDRQIRVRTGREVECAGHDRRILRACGGLQ
ncbi:hypothetical protein XH88_25195, partial [Bradyrhizobium sp. CCBAU 51627]|nr:hypothetical protein [Bradyrhizobium sp. CCBAU 51627]